MFSQSKNDNILQQTLEQINDCNDRLDSKNITLSELATSSILLIANIIKLFTALGKDLNLNSYYAMELENLQRYLDNAIKYDEEQKMDKMFSVLTDMENSLKTLKGHLLGKSKTAKLNSTYNHFIINGYLDRLISVFYKAANFALSENVKGISFPSEFETDALTRSQKFPCCPLF